MTKALTFIEIDPPRCDNTYGVSPCRARLMSSTYTQVGVNFDGTNDYMTRGADLTSDADTKVGTLSFWFRVGGGDGTSRYLIANTSDGFRARLRTTNVLEIRGQSAAASTVLLFETVATFLNGSGWHHVLATWSLSVSRLQVYIDGVLDAGSSTTIVNTDIDYTKADWAVGADTTGANKFFGDVGDLWFDNANSVDLSVQANREKFISSSFHPVDLGTDGSTPNLSGASPAVAPRVYLSSTLATWHTNKGTGGGFTLGGGSPPTAALTASAGGSGTHKCFNTKQTCQDRTNYVADTPVTLRFAKPALYLREVDIFAIPSIVDVSFTSTVVSLGKDLGQRASIDVTFRDHRDDDSTPGLDPYLSDRDYNPYEQGTFWGKFRARNPFIVGSAIRLITGYAGQDLADMETRNFIIEGYDGPSNGVFKIKATDVLKLADPDKSVAPFPSSGYLLSDITSTASQLTLTPTGVGDEYTDGYLNIGGSELVRYWRGGDEAENVLLLHCEGADASTTFTDSSAVPHTVTAVGNAQVDTAQKKFGTSSALFDGAGDYLRLDGSSDFAFGTGDFTIDFWARKNVNSTNMILYDGRPSATNGAYPTLFFTNANAIQYFTNSALQINAGSTTTGVFYHIALVRQSGVTKLYLDGVLLGSVVDTSNYLNGTQRPVIGLNGNDLSTSPMNGWIDEIRVTKGYARWSAAFTPPPMATPITGSDILNIPYRAQLNTLAVAHTAQDRAQHVLSYVSEDPADIIYDLLTEYVTGFDASWIDLTAWQLETATYNGNVYTGYVTEPTSVKQLIEELVLQGAMALWWDDLNDQMRLKVIHSISTTAFDFTPENYIRGSTDIAEQLESRLSQVFIYFGQINPLLPLSNKDNFRSQSIATDTEAEDNWLVAAIKIIQSRWIPQSGRTVADRLATVLLGRYKNPPRKLNFDVQRYSNDISPELGEGYQFFNAFVQDDTGATEDAFIPIQVTQIKVGPSSLTVMAEEMLYDVPATDLTNRTIIIDANRYNINLRTEHNSIYPTPTGTETVTFTINSGVKVGSITTATPAVDVGTWPAGTVINIINNGRIQGKGGRGGPIGTGFGDSHAGFPGGTALYTRRAISLTNNSEVFGGGGGGGATANTAGGGGGGAGYDPGAGGGGLVSAGNAGTTEAGGGGAVNGSQVGGTGGGPGLAGGTDNLATNAGGAAGAAVDGTSFVTYAVAGDRRGGLVN